MFRHIVLYTLREDQKDQIEEMCRRFRSMEENIPQIAEIEVGADREHTARSCDVALSMLFQTREDYLDYRQHPYHREEVAPFVHGIVQTAVSCDFEMERNAEAPEGFCGERREFGSPRLDEV